MIWFLLFDGQSADGMGRGSYTNRTSDPLEAMEHLAKEERANDKCTT